MAHDLSFNSEGKAEMFVNRAKGKALTDGYNNADGTPWHRYGTVVEEAQDSQQAMLLAGLDKPILPLPVFAQLPDGSYIPVPERTVNVRSDNHEIIGIVSSEYKLIQNWESFAFMDSLLSDGTVKYESAGAFGKGERVWLLAVIPGHVIRVGKTDDIVNQYMLLYNSHNGTSKLRVFPTPIRVVCWNTCSAALRKGQGQGIAIAHTGDIESKIAEARRVLGLASDYFTAFGEGANEMVRFQPNRDQLKAYFDACLPENVSERRVVMGKRDAHLMTLHGLFDMGMGNDMPGVKGSLWAAYNAVTEFIDHHAGKDSSRRLKENWVGHGAEIKRGAFDLAMQLVAKPHGELAPVTLSAGNGDDEDGPDNEPDGGAVVVKAGPKTAKLQPPKAKGRARKPVPSNN